MSEEISDDFREFYFLVLSDLSLQKTLRAIRNRKEFTDVFVKLGAEKGFIFTEEEVVGVMQQNYRLWIERWM